MICRWPPTARIPAPRTAPRPRTPYCVPEWWRELIDAPDEDAADLGPDAPSDTSGHDKR